MLNTQSQDTSFVYIKLQLYEVIFKISYTYNLSIYMIYHRCIVLYDEKYDIITYIF